ncbi:MAG: YciI family protein [Myxococcota bacterium]
MQYILLLYASESSMSPTPAPGTPEFAEYMRPWEEYTQALQNAGVMRGGEALEPVATATTVSRGEREPVLTDGPFAETKEQLGGFYLIECDHLDAALGWAGKCPILADGRVEVRPISVFE